MNWKQMLFNMLVIGCFVQNVSAQFAINILALTGKVSEKGLKETNLGLYQGNLLLQAMAEFSVAANNEAAMARSVALLKKFATKEIEGKRSFISYGAAYLAYLGVGEPLNTQVSQAARQMAAKQKRSGEGLITMVKGINFSKVENVIQTNAKEDIIVGIGLTTFGHPLLMKNAQTGLLSLWEKADSTHGYVGTAVVADPAQLTGFANSTGDEYLLLKVAPGKPVVYYVGADRSGNKRFSQQGAWSEMMNAEGEWRKSDAFYSSAANKK